MQSALSAAMALCSVWSLRCPWRCARNGGGEPVAKAKNEVKLQRYLAWPTADWRDAELSSGRRCTGQANESTAARDAWPMGGRCSVFLGRQATSRQAARLWLIVISLVRILISLSAYRCQCSRFPATVLRGQVGIPLQRGYGRPQQAPGPTVAHSVLSRPQCRLGTAPLQPTQGGSWHSF